MYTFMFQKADFYAAQVLRDSPPFQMTLHYGFNEGENVAKKLIFCLCVVFFFFCLDGKLWTVSRGKRGIDCVFNQLDEKLLR